MIIPMSRVKSFDAQGQSLSVDYSRDDCFAVISLLMSSIVHW